MKIENRGTPIYVAPRRGRGITIHQGSSKIMVSPSEIPALIRSITAAASG